MNVKFVDLESTHAEVEERLLERVTQSISENVFIGGCEVEQFEERWAKFCGVDHAIGVANGTDALVLGLRALGIGVGDEVIVPANTFIATAEAVALAGASPRFVDVDDATLLTDASLVEAAITSRTAAVIVVHLYGQVCDMAAMSAVAQRHGIALIEDACQAHGAAWSGRKAGSFGDFAAFSFYPGKNLGALGDGGAVVTGDKQLADRIRSLGNHGRGAPMGMNLVATNSRLDGLQAAALNVKLDHLDRWNAQRRVIAARYTDELQGAMGIRVTDQRAESHSVHHLFVVRVRSRDKVREKLATAGIQTGVHYDIACHLHPAFEQYASDGSLPVSEQAAEQVLSLPMHPHLSTSEVIAVSTAVRDIVSAYSGDDGDEH